MTTVVIIAPHVSDANLRPGELAQLRATLTNHMFTRLEYQTDTGCLILESEDHISRVLRDLLRTIRVIRFPSMSKNRMLYDSILLMDEPSVTHPTPCDP